MNIAPSSPPASRFDTSATAAAQNGLQDHAKGASADWIARRKGALERFRTRGLPTTKQEAWHYTDVGFLKGWDLTLSTPSALSQEQMKALSVPTFEADGKRLAIVLNNGSFDRQLSSITKIPGVTIESLNTILTTDGSALAAQFGTLSAKAEAHPFLDLNEALFNDGIAIHIARNTTVTTPIQILNITHGTKDQSIVPSRILVTLEDGAQATIIEHLLSLGNESVLGASVSEVIVGAAAHATVIRINQPNAQRVQLSQTHATIARDATFTSHHYNFSGKLNRNEIIPRIIGANATVNLNGLSVLAGDELADNVTALEHGVAHGTSNQLFKGIYNDRSHGVFTGTIVVQPGAVKINAFQSNRSIILSPNASSDTRPQLKIWADDVKCTHGATVGQLDENALFYIRSRGVSEVDARNMLIHAFASDVTATIEFAPLADYLQLLLTANLNRSS
jgi:Fe-S cluster assembly protein SufD